MDLPLTLTTLESRCETLGLPCPAWICGPHPLLEELQQSVKHEANCKGVKVESTPANWAPQRQDCGRSTPPSSGPTRTTPSLKSTFENCRG